MPKAKEKNLKKKGKPEKGEEEKIIEVDEETVAPVDEEAEPEEVIDETEDGGIDDEDVNPFGDRWEE